MGRIGSYSVAKEFNRAHFKVLQLIAKHKKNFMELETEKALLVSRVPQDHAGRPINEILLNEKQYILLGTLFRNTEKVLEFKTNLAKEYGGVK